MACKYGHFVDLQRVNGVCESVHRGIDYKEADIAYRYAIDHAGADVANVTWYFNAPNDQQHLGTRIFKGLN